MICEKLKVCILMIEAPFIRGLGPVRCHPRTKQFSVRCPITVVWDLGSESAALNLPLETTSRFMMV
jgi:hypothetical protein